MAPGKIKREMSHEEKLAHVREQQLIDRMNKMNVRMMAHHREICRKHVPKWAQWASVHIPPRWFMLWARQLTVMACPVPMMFALFVLSTAEVSVFRHVPPIVSLALFLSSLVTIWIPLSAIVWNISVFPIIRRKNVSESQMQKQIERHKQNWMWMIKLVFIPFDFFNLILAIIIVKPFAFMRKRFSLWGIRWKLEKTDEWTYKTRTYFRGKLIDEREWCA